MSRPKVKVLVGVEKKRRTPLPRVSPGPTLPAGALGREREENQVEGQGVKMVVALHSLPGVVPLPVPHVHWKETTPMR